MAVFAVGTRKPGRNQKVTPEAIVNALTLPPVELISGPRENKSRDIDCVMLLKIYKSYTLFYYKEISKKFFFIIKFNLYILIIKFIQFI
jgi:hypothetical protein